MLIFVYVIAFCGALIFSLSSSFCGLFMPDLNTDPLTFLSLTFIILLGVLEFCGVREKESNLKYAKVIKKHATAIGLLTGIVTVAIAATAPSFLEAGTPPIECPYCQEVVTSTYCPDCGVKMDLKD